MSREAPWYKFYAARWLGDHRIKLMTPEQRGYLIQLHAEAWESEPPGTLPADPAKLWLLAGARSRRQFERVSAAVLENFELHEGRYFCHDLLEQHEGLAAVHESRRRAAVAGGKARWSSRTQPRAMPLAMPNAEPDASQVPAYQNRTEREQRRSDAIPGTRRWEIEQQRIAAQADREKFAKGNRR